MFRLWKLGRKRPAQAPENTRGAAAPSTEVSEEASADAARAAQGDGLRNAVARGTAEGSAREVVREFFKGLLE